MFKKILIPIDGSDAAQKAVLTAKNLAEKYDSEVIALYVIMRQLPIMEEHAFQNLGDTQIIPPPDDFELFKKVRETFGDAEITLKARIELGHPPHAIVNVANEEDVDIIVIGNRGLSGLSTLFLGSVSKQVVNDAGCPVLVVK